MNDLRQRYDFLFDGTGDLTQETLLLYVFGPLESEARQAVEQHLAECEMCRDAAEGMALLGTKEQALALLAATDAKLLERVETLKQKVTRDGREELINQAEPVVLKAERTERRIGWYRYAAAASVIMVVGVAFWLFNRNMEGGMDSNIAQVYEDSASHKTEQNRQDQTMAVEAAPTDSLSTIVSGSTAPYAFDWADTAPPSTTFQSEGFATGTYTVTVQDESGYVASKTEDALKPSEPEDEFKNVPTDYETDDLVMLEENTVADKYKSEAPASKEKKKNEDAVAGNVAPAPTVTATAPPSTLNKGSNSFDNNVYLNNIAATDIAIIEAQYPGGSEAIQQYFDQIQYPSPITKGYKGVATFEVSFDKKGKITTASIISGLGEPYDKLLLDHLKKMPAWTPPQPNGKPVESVRFVTVEVTVR